MDCCSQAPSPPPRGAGPGVQNGISVNFLSKLQIAHKLWRKLPEGKVDCFGAVRSQCPWAWSCILGGWTPPPPDPNHPIRVYKESPARIIVSRVSPGVGVGAGLSGNPGNPVCDGGSSSSARKWPLPREICRGRRAPGPKTDPSPWGRMPALGTP